MDLAKRLKLYRIKTVLKYIPESWSNSQVIANQYITGGGNRLRIFMSMLYWYYFYGNDFENFCAFRFWNRTREEKKSYLSTRRNDKLRFALSTPKVHKIFLDKVSFNQRFSKYIKRNWQKINEGDSEAIEDFIKQHGTAIFKPRTECGGQGVKKIAENTSFIPECDGIIEECIENIGSIKSLAPNSLNTIRVVTVIDKNKEVRIISAVLRMGDGFSHTDNYSDGGLACAINLETGCLRGNAYGANCKEYEKHPFSGITFDGYEIEQFNNCLQIAKELALVEPDARYVGWDIAVTNSGIDIIEGNIPPGQNITQIGTGRGMWYELSNMI